MPEGKLEKADLVTRARCLGPLSGLRPAQLKRLIEATAHEHSGCVEKAELIACLLAAIEAGGKATTRERPVTDEQGLEPGKSNFRLAAQEWSERERELADEMAARARTAAERYRTEETLKARAMLAAAEVEEQKEAEEREAAAAERRWLQERKVLLQVEAANQQVKLLEKRLAL
jgi:GAF domain-containing protein